MVPAQNSSLSAVTRFVPEADIATTGQAWPANLALFCRRIEYFGDKRPRSLCGRNTIQNRIWPLPLSGLLALRRGHLRPRTCPCNPVQAAAPVQPVRGYKGGGRHASCTELHASCTGSCTLSRTAFGDQSGIEPGWPSVGFDVDFVGCEEPLHGAGKRGV
jgi:hypothetical protein